MDAKKKLFCILLLREFKQHVDSCFVYLSDKEEQRKQYSGNVNMTLENISYHQPDVYFRSLVLYPFFLVKVTALTCVGIHVNFPSLKNVFDTTTSSSESVLLSAWACYLTHFECTTEGICYFSGVKHS